MNRVVGFARTAAWVALVLGVVAPAAAAFKYVELGQEAPLFTLETLEGEQLSLRETVADAKVTAVVFWAAWSPRSAPMLAELEALYGARREAGLRVLAVNVEHEELDAEAREQVAAEAAKLSFPVVVDVGLATYYAYGVVATPTLALLDEAGIVRYVRASYSSSAKLEIREQVLGMLGVEAESDQARPPQVRSYVPPKKATLHYQKAQVLIQRGRPQRAVRDLEQAAELDPLWAEPRVLLARIYRDHAAKDPASLEKAAAVLGEAERIQPRHVQTLALYAEVLVQLARHAEGLAAAERALAVEPGFTPALLARAQALRAQGDLAGARATVEDALALSPWDPAALREQGNVASAAGNWQEAAAALRRATEAALAGATRQGR